MFRETLIPRIGAAEMRVELDKKSLFALASDTRLDILRSLQPMRRTVTQLAETLNIDKAAVHRHLKKLEEGGLVKRFEEHGFVYYGLSWKARDLMSPNENTRIIVMISSTWILTIIVAFLMISAFVATGLFGTGGSTGGEKLEPTNGGDQYGNLAPSAAEPFPWLFVVPAAVLAAIAITLVYESITIMRRPVQPADKGSAAAEDRE